LSIPMNQYTGIFTGTVTPTIIGSNNATSVILRFTGSGSYTA
jgi:hypothetical protein